MSEPAIFRAFPALAERIPHRPLGVFPTKIERICDEAALAPGCELWVKREDACGPLYGGNKVRKLEFLLADALERRSERVITVGGYGSHQVLATALYARSLGLGVDAVVAPQPITPHVLETIRAGVAAGCVYHPAASYAGVPARVAALRVRRRTRWITAGGSSPLGTLGWVSAGFEIAAQISAGECPAFDVIYVALGSCGTAAGLLLGLRLSGLATPIVAVRVVDEVFTNGRVARRLAQRTRRLIEKHTGEKLRVEVGAFEVEGGFFGGAYGRPTDEGLAAMEIGDRAGLALETTYTAKTLAALRAHAAAGKLAGKRALFIDTYSSIRPPLAPIEALVGAKETAGPDALPARLARLFGPNSQNMT